MVCMNRGAFISSSGKPVADLGRASERCDKIDITAKTPNSPSSTMYTIVPGVLITM